MRQKQRRNEGNMRHEKIDIVIEDAEVSESQPALYTYILDNTPSIDENRKRPAVLICPGGGYIMTSDREAEPIAIRMNAMGFHAFILRYSVAPSIFPAAQLEAAKAMLIIRERGEEWKIDVNKVIILGFSAGGHLAGCIGTMWNKEFIYGPLQAMPECIKPNGMVLCYPVITSGKYEHKGSFKALLGEKEEELRDFVSLENQVSAETPPAFIWHTYEDGSVPVENSMLFAMALRKNKVPFELHIYPRGRHGLSLASEETSSVNGEPSIVKECQNWIDMAGAWIRNL